MKQTDIILIHCSKYRTVTRLDAIELGVFDLPGVIRDIKALGYAVSDIWRKGVNRHGTKVKWKEYTIDLEGSRWN